MLAGYTGFWVASVSGWLGASFFMLAELQRRMGEGSLDDAREMWGFSFIILRCLVGAGGALVLYFFFQSGLLKGSPWPDLVKLGYDPCCNASKTLLVPNQHLALLIIWSFLAGYSQTLVPSILVSTEASARSSGSPPTQR